MGRGKDIFDGVEMPWHSASPMMRWVSLSIVVISGAFATGPMQSWPTLEPLLIDMGVWEGADPKACLSEVYSVALAVVMGSGFFSGIAFDVLGPRFIIVTGAWGTSLCLAGIALAISYRSLNFLLWLFYPLCNFFAMLNLYGGYAWVWLLPESQNTVTGMVGAITSLSDSVVVVFVWLKYAHDVSLATSFLVMALLGLAAGVIGAVLSPSAQDHRRNADMVRRYLLVEAEGDGAEACFGSAPAHPEERDKGEEVGHSVSMCSEDVVHTVSMRSIADSIVTASAVSTLIHPTATFLFAGFNMSGYMWAVYPTVEMYPFYEAMFDRGTARTLVNIFGGIAGIAGAVALIGCGRMMDYLGFKVTFAWMQLPLLVCTGLLCVSSFNAQLAAQMFLAVLSNVFWTIFLPRFCVHYVPAELFGTWTGLLTTVLGLGQFFLTPLTSVLCKMIQELWEGVGFFGKLGAAGYYKLSFVFWYIWAEVFLLLFLRHIRTHPIPAANCIQVTDARKAIHATICDYVGVLWG